MAKLGKKSGRSRSGQARRGYKKRPWKRRELLMLGIISDAKVAERIGRSEADVRAERIRQGIRSAERRTTNRPPILSPREKRLWKIYQAAIEGQVGMVPVALGWLAAEGWEPTAMEMLSRAGVGRSTAYRHLALLREWRAWLKAQRFT